MGIKFHISKIGNTFHILDSVSDWDTHTRKRIRTWYEARFGISDEDKTFLEQYKPIRKMSGWGGLDSAFIPAKNYQQALSQAREILPSLELETLEKVFQHFSKNIEKMYQDNESKLTQRKEDLEQEVQNHNWEQMFSDVASFYSASGYPKDMHVHLLMNPYDGWGGGGANLSPKNHVTLEPHYLGKRDLCYVLIDLDTAAHEISHTISGHADSNKLKKYSLLTGIMGLSGVEEDILREAIADTLSPNGFLSVRYGLKPEEKVTRKIKEAKTINIPLPQEGDDRQYRRDFRRKLSAHLYAATSSALSSGNSVFDRDYLEKAIDALISLRPTLIEK